MIYQVFVGRHQDANLKDHPSQVLKRMANWPWQNLKPLGIKTIYLFGLFDSRGPILVNDEAGLDLSGMPDRLPSPFALSDHERLHPDLGKLSDLTVLLNLLHSHDLKVIVDFVPNHTGTSHPWVKAKPDYYHYQDSDQPVAEFSGDVYKLNYEHPDLVAAMTQVLKTIASWGVDGVRVDMAHLVPNHFWVEAIEIIKHAYPAFVFYAEAYSDSVFNWQPLNALVNTGFDGLYHEPLYRQLTLSSDNTSMVQNLAAHLNYILTQYQYRDKLIHYCQNHDDPFPEKFRYAAPSLIALLYLLPGTGFIYNGQLNGQFDRLSHHRLDILAQDVFEIFHPPQNIKLLLDLKQQLNGQPTAADSADNGNLRLSFAGGQHLNLNFDPSLSPLPLEIKS